MWRTECGDRILEGSEGIVFAEALWDLIEEANLIELDDYHLGVNAFDVLTYGQKISALSIIANGLLREDVPSVELTAVVEGAIAAVFEHLKTLIVVEIDMPELGARWREMVVTVRKEAESEDIPLPTCKDLKEWDIEVESLAEAILWDADYDDDHIYMDHPPENSKWLRSMARISDNYYQSIVDDLDEPDIETKIAELRKLCRSICSKYEEKESCED